MPEHTNSPILASILKHLGQPNLPELLATKMSGTELNTLLLEVFARQTSSMSPGELLNHYGKNRLVKPADLPVIASREMELDYLYLLNKCGFEPV